AHIHRFRCASKSFREGARSPLLLYRGKALSVLSLALRDAEFWEVLYRTKACVRTWSSLEPRANACDNDIAFARARPGLWPANVRLASNKSKRPSTLVESPNVGCA